jgi:hypothetical protein
MLAYQSAMGYRLEQMHALIGAYIGDGGRDQRADVPEAAVGADFGQMDIETALSIQSSLRMAVQDIERLQHPVVSD